MFKNIGGKIKGLAVAIFVICLVVYGISGIACLIAGFVMLANGLAAGGLMIFLALVVFGVGFLFAWLSALVPYGFGELVAKVCSIEKEVCKKTPEQANPQPEYNFAAYTTDNSQIL